MNLKENIKYRLRSKLYEMTVGGISSKEQLGTETQSIPQKQDPRTLNVQQGMNRQSPNYRRGYPTPPPYGTPGVLIPPYDDWNRSPIRFKDDNGVDTIMTNPYLRNIPDIGSVDSDLENRDVTGEQGGEGNAPPGVYELPFNPKILDEPPDFYDAQGSAYRIVRNRDGSILIITGKSPPYTVTRITKNHLRGGLNYLVPHIYDPDIGYINPAEYYEHWYDADDILFNDVWPGWNPFTGDPPPGGSFDPPARPGQVEEVPL